MGKIHRLARGIAVSVPRFGDEHAWIHRHNRRNITSAGGRGGVAGKVIARSLGALQTRREANLPQGKRGGAPSLVECEFAVGAIWLEASGAQESLPGIVAGDHPGAQRLRPNLTSMVGRRGQESRTVPGAPCRRENFPSDDRQVTSVGIGVIAGGERAVADYVVALGGDEDTVPRARRRDDRASPLQFEVRCRQVREEFRRPRRPEGVAPGSLLNIGDR